MDFPRPIFVVGCPRSGTTLLTALLHAHPNIAMPPETRFLISAYRRREEFGDLRVEANRRRLAERVTGRGTHFADLKLDRTKTVEAIVDAPPTLGTAFATIWQEFARSRGKQRWGEKRPAYWREMGPILRLFPTAQIVHLVRDPRACVASLQHVPWWGGEMTGAAAVWIMSNRELDRVGRKLPAEQYHKLRYEDLLHDQRGTLKELCAYLGENFDEGMIDHASAAQDIVPGRKTWHGLVQKPLDTARIEAWRDDLTPRDIGLVEFTCRRLMTKEGYRFSGAGARPAPREVAEVVKRIATTRVWNVKRAIADAKLRRRFPMPLAAQL